jgi:signal transduction histidine kinase
MKISVFIFLGFLIILSMFSITTYINFRLSEQVNENYEWLGKSTNIVRSSNRFQRNILNMVSGLRGYLFSGEEYFIQAYDSAARENEQILEELKGLMPAGSVQRTSLQQISDLNSRWLDEYAGPLIEAKKASADSDSSQTAFNRLYRTRLQSGIEVRLNNALNTRLRNFINYEYSVRDMRKEALDRSINQTRNISLYLTSFSIATGLLIAGFLAFRISRRIITMVRMADTIASGNYQVHTEDSGKDELSKLAKSLNHMASVLSENISLLKRKNTELDQFAHIVSHDMKAPLRGIDNVVTWIEEDHIEELSPKVREYMGLIKSRIVRGENLIHGILSYSRVGQYEVEREYVDLNAMMQEIRENLPLRIGLRLQVQPKLPTLYTQRVPIMQIFSNLISNAIKYHDKPNGKIKVYYREHPDHYIFFVEDNGPGIARIYHHKIFTIFQTLNGNDSFENTGVGLAIVRKILDDRKQTIKLHSEPGKGSTFEFTWSKE